MRLASNLFAALAVLLAAQTASAQSSYPNRPVKILVGFTPGTAPDLAARILADRFSEVWGSPFVVENIPGAGSNIATDRVAKAAADGYTLLMGGNSSLVINPSLYETLPFDPLRDFAPISQIFIAANVLAVPSELPVKTVAELVALAKAQPGKLSYGHAGVGTSQHLAAELFKYMARVDIVPVAYRGTTAFMPDLLAGRIAMSFANIVNVMPLAREGKLRALAITSLKRSALAPDLATMAESGFPGFEAVPWFGLLAPAGTPKDVLDKMHGETVKALALPQVRKRFDELGLEPVGNTPAEFAAIIQKETPEWAKVIRDAGIKLGN
ncbi:MAG TPA: tripartite tricarboxylate transporter substrate binding protein [Bradyrhizobium sp.]|jgi:tripartite-type tricarboxylate transporter receptor subunit TctC